jgi:hypothetical integral membrane protein (TIGR02206 family)
LHLFPLFSPGFQNYNLEHLIWLALGMASCFFWIWLGKKQRTEIGQRRVGLIQSLLPVAMWCIITLYVVFFERPIDLGLVLPFHACYFINLVLPFMLWRRSYFLFEITYFMVMAGCIQALITPDMQDSFPHPINMRYFFIHIGLVQSILYAALVYQFRPSWRSLGKAFLWSNYYFIGVLGVNYLLNTNFMYLRQKPPTPSLLDLFGEWPWYIVGGEILCLLMFTIVMLPFAFDAKQEERLS